MQQAKRWQFDFSTNEDVEEYKAVQAAAKFLNKYADQFPSGFLPGNTTQQAIIAIRVYQTFLPVRDIVKDADVEKTVEAIVSVYESNK